jgi:diguanylate cyclase (GGDEF)-like protein
MGHFLIAEPAETMWPTLADALDCVDIGIVLLDRDMGVRFVNDRLIELFELPLYLLARRPHYRDLVIHSGTTGKLAIPPERLHEFIEERVQAVQSGSMEPVRLDLANGLSLRFSCKTCSDGGRILSYAEISAELQREAQDAKEQVAAEFRFNTQLLEDQGAYLASLCEAADENARKAEDARRQLEKEIAERRHLEDELRLLATIDGLTGILNRPAFLAAAQQEMERARGSTLIMLMLDVDHFKSINDLYGHAGGDLALKNLVATVRSGLRDRDLLGRLGGEEFAVLLHAVSLEDGVAIAERLRSRVETTRLTFGGEVIAMTMSVGLAARQPADQTIDQVIARADAALYCAKRSGRNRVVTDVSPVAA